MPSCCRTCDHREHAVHSTVQTLLCVAFIVLDFRVPVSLNEASSVFKPWYTELKSVLRHIRDAADSTSHPYCFTTWSPCLDDKTKVAILTTSTETCSEGTSPIFGPLLRHLKEPPSVQHVMLDYGIVSVGSPEADKKTPCDLIFLKAPDARVAGAIGKRFGWVSKKSSLSSQTDVKAGAAFSRPGDLIRDFWGWSELPRPPLSPSISHHSHGSYESAQVLRSTNTDEKNMALDFPEDEDDAGNRDDEGLVMLFQWSSHTDGDRFKHPLQQSVGPNGEDVSPDLWDRHIANPVRQLQSVGAKVERYKLELRGVDDKLEVDNNGAGARERSGSRRLSTMATEFSDRLSGLWR